MRTSSKVLTTAVALGALGALTGCQTGSGGDEPTTAWEWREELSQVLVETAEAVGLEPEQQDNSQDPVPCSLPDGGDGTAFPLVVVNATLDRPGAEVIEDVAEYWKSEGLGEGIPGENRLIVRTADDGSLDAMAAPNDLLVLFGTTPCMADAGGPTD